MYHQCLLAIRLMSLNTRYLRYSRNKMYAHRKVRIRIDSQLYNENIIRSDKIVYKFSIPFNLSIPQIDYILTFKILISYSILLNPWIRFHECSIKILQ